MTALATASAIRRAALVAALLSFIHLFGHAQGTLLKVPTRPGVKTTLFWEVTNGARATLLLFPGGAGGFGKVEDGKPAGGNFLVRSVPHFLAQGFNVAIFGRPDDTQDLGWAERTGPAHLADMQAVLAFVKLKSSAPVWIVGTSRGTVSATAMAIGMQDPAIAGLVLSASAVRRGTPGNVPGQDLAAIRMPVLVLHHRKDACHQCQPRDVPAILEGLSHAPARKLVWAEGGGPPEGDVCGATHWHGFIGMEQQAVGIISDWIRQPTN